MRVNEKVIFPEPEDLGFRTWGVETLLALVPGKFSFKRLEMKAGTKGGLQYHQLKDEVQILISGKLLIRYDDTGSGSLKEKTIESGDCVHFYPGLVHQEEALTDCVLIEASTPHFNDRVRVEERYGVETNGGLPSTTLQEIIER